MNEAGWLLTRYGATALAATLSLAVPGIVRWARRYREQRRIVQRPLFCAQRRAAAVVEFEERTRDALTLRTVRDCSLRGRHEQCNEECRYLLVAVAPDRDACMVERRLVSA